MKIKQEEITKKIEEQDYLQDLETIKYSEITKTKLKNIATKMINEAVQAFKHDSLVQTQLAISGRRPMTFALESNIINLPFANYKKISNFCNNEDEYEVNIYFETISEYVNVSHFRIDIFHSRGKHVGFRFPERRFAEKELPLKIGDVDCVEVGNADPAYSGGGEIHGAHRAERTATDHEHTRLL